MKLQQRMMLLASLAMMGGAALFLSHWREVLKLGPPGVRVVAKPIFDPQGQVAGTNSVDVPEQVLDFQSEALPVDFTELRGLPQDTIFAKRIYRAPDGFKVQMNAILMGTDRSSIHPPQACLSGAGWQVWQTERLEIPIAKPRPYQLPATGLFLAQEFRLSNDAKTVKHAVVVYWFVTDKRISADYLGRFGRMTLDMVLTGVLQRWASLSCFAECDVGQEALTLNRLQEFIAAAVPQFQLAVGAPSGLAENP